MAGILKGKDVADNTVTPSKLNDWPTGYNAVTTNTTQTITGNKTFTGTINTNNILPNSTNTYIGNATNNFGNGYFLNLYKGGSSVLTINDVQTAKQIVTSRIPATGNMLLGTTYTVGSITAPATKTNATINAYITFDPDDSGFLLVDTFALKNIRVQAIFTIGSTTISAYKNVCRSNNLESVVFEVNQNVTSGQTVSVSITATSGSNGAEIFVPANENSNYITIK